MSIRAYSLQVVKQKKSTEVVHMGTISDVYKTTSTSQSKNIPSVILTDSHVNNFILSPVRENRTLGSNWEGVQVTDSFTTTSEAVTELLKYAREHIDVDYIIAYADIGNIGSTRVMEKCGMTYYKNDIAKGIECRFYRIKNRQNGE